MKQAITIAIIFLSGNLHAQYYYNDIVSTADFNRLMKTYQANKVRTVSATGFDKQGTKTADFSEFQEVKDNGSTLKVSSFNNLNKSVTYNRFDAQLRITNMLDSSGGIQSETKYTYDGEGRVVAVQNVVSDPANSFTQTEIHKWEYSFSGKPQKMWRVINSPDTGNDTLEIRFVQDEQGNIAEERTFRRGLETGYLYYYYDEKNRLTDIVRYNNKLKKLLPDIMFEYDESDRAIQKITPTSSIALGYLIWRYVFDEKGLKTKEALFNDDKQMTGKIEYAYVFGH